MQTFIVFWRGDYEVTQSEVNLPDDINAGMLIPSQWLEHAARAEEMDDEDIQALLQHGYDLYAVLRGPVDFVY